VGPARGHWHHGLRRQRRHPQTIQDVIGRQVTLDLPAKRILLGFYIEDYFAIGGDKSFDKLAGMSRGWFVKSRPGVWAQYVARQPALQNVPDVGDVQDQTFSIEKALATRPDGVILAEWQYKALGPNRAGSRWWCCTTSTSPRSTRTA
jgi:iron complex transport system substrate-binding protein